jgi:hypothetical protein
MPLKRIAFCLALATGVWAWVDPGPQPPCGAAPVPRYPAPDAAPAVKVWTGPEPGQSWAPPPCTGWTAAGFSTLVAAAGRFRYAGGADGLRRRVGAVSAMTGIRYWSTTDRQWRPLMLDAYAMTGAGGPRRGDFGLEEVSAGRTLSLLENDSRLGKAEYRMRVREATPTRLVFELENTTAVRFTVLTLLEPGQGQAIYFLDRESANVWRYYALARTAREASAFALAAGREGALVNRAVAFYRYIAGIPTDAEPPAVR